MLKAAGLVSLIVAFVFPISFSAQSPRIAAPDYSKEAFVFEQSSDKFKFENDGTYTREMHMRVRIQSDAGVQHFSVVKFVHRNLSELFAVDYVRVTKADGSVVVTPPDTFLEMPADITREAPFYTDTYETHAAVKGLGVGDLLEYQAHWQDNKPLIPKQFWLDYNFAHEGIVLQEIVEVSVPLGRAVKLKSSKIQPAVAESGRYRVYTWTSSNLEEKDDKKKKQDQQESTWQQVRGRQPQPEIELSSFKNWEELGDWYQGLQRDRVKPSPEIQSKAAELTKGIADENAKIHALYDFVSTKYRYIGIAFGLGRYQPHAAAEVLANQYGDCKDKHTLFASLLNALGIKAYPALISTAYEIDTDVPSPGQFDHVITAIPHGTGFLWLDTTAEIAPFAFLMAPLRDKHAFIIPDDQPAAMAATPADDPFPTLQKFDMRATLSDSGTLEGKAENLTRGDTELLLRAAFRTVPLPQWKDLVQRFSYALGFGGDVSDVDASRPDNVGEPFHFRYNYKRKDYSDWSNRRITPPMPIITLPQIDDEILPTAPIWLGSPGEIEFRSTLELPKGYSPKLPKAVHIKRDFADFDATYSFQSGVITAERHMLIKLREVPTPQYGEYKTFRKAVEDDYETYTSLSIGKSASSSLTSYQDEIWNLPYSENTDAAKLYDEAREQYQRNDTQAEIASLKRAVGIDPKFLRAWLWLGEIYKATGQNDLALECYRSAIAVDPEEAVSYKALGITLLGLRRGEEAVIVWQQLVKAVPDSGFGYASLGTTLLSLKRYREAVSPLETAVKLSPDQADLQLRLGIAYLNTEEIEKSQAAFAVALKLDSSAVMLNDIAYSLAEQNTDLDKAREYAEKAVHEVEEASTKTRLSELQLSDLNQPRQLAVFWDTLGWVYYQQNDLAASEACLKAAWILSQHPVSGRHLGQLYERQKKRAAALHVYQLAYSASPMRPVLPAPNGNPGFKKDASDLEQDIHRLGGAEPSTFMEDLNRMRTFKLPRIVSGTATAEVFVLLGPGRKVEAKFISGSNSLKNIQSSLQSVNFNLEFPDDRPTRVLRRGIVGCYQYTGCSFVLMMPDTVSSIQ